MRKYSEDGDSSLMMRLVEKSDENDYEMRMMMA